MKKARLFKLSALVLMMATATWPTARAELVTGRDYIVNREKEPRTPAKPKKKYPAWMSVEVVSGNYNSAKKLFVFTIRHTNKSKDRIITALYDKTLNFKLTDKNGNVKYSYEYSSAKATNVNVRPGQSVTLRYEIDIKQSTIDWKNRNKGNRYRLQTYDLRIKDKKL